MVQWQDNMMRTVQYSTLGQKIMGILDSNFFVFGTLEISREDEFRLIESY